MKSEEPSSILISPDAIQAAMHLTQSRAGTTTLVRFFEYMLHKNQKDPNYERPEGLKGYVTARVNINSLTGDIVIRMSRKDAERGGEKVALDLLKLQVKQGDVMTDMFLHAGKTYEPLNKRPAKDVEYRAIKRRSVKFTDLIDRYAEVYQKEFKKALQYESPSQCKGGMSI